MSVPASQQPGAALPSVPHWIEGRALRGSGPSCPVYNPSLGRAVREVTFASAEEVDRAVAGAQRAFAEWSGQTPLSRARILFRLKELLDRDARRVARLICEEHGKTLDDALGEVKAAA